MKKLLLKIGLLLTGFAAMPSWGITINDGGLFNGQNVGQVDSFIAQESHTGPGGDPAGETIWVNSVLGVLTPSVTFTIKYDPVTYYATDAANHFAFELADNIDYFLVKNSTYRALFENNDNFGWGVFDTTPLLSGFNLPDDSSYQISHVTQFSSGDTVIIDIPEPLTVTLFFMGMLCFLVARRKKHSK
jgi:hypothetical protein